MDEVERQELKSHLDACPVCRAELADLAQVWSDLREIPAITPDSSAMRLRFNALSADRPTSTGVAGVTALDVVRPGTLQTAAPGAGYVETRPAAWLRRHAVLRPALQACAALLLVLIGIQLGHQTIPSSSADVRQLSQEVHELKQMVILSLMQEQSASERLKGVNWSSQLDRPGNEIVAALIDALMHDANVNVRMASIDALKRFAERDTVRAATLQALGSQASPLVQMALIDFVVETRDRGAIDALRRLSRDRTADPSVRARATWGIDHLESV